MRPSRRILLIEDDPELAELTRLRLADCGYEVRVEHDGRSGHAAASSGAWDLLVLDLGLPRLDGLAICRDLRTGRHAADRARYLPILVLTARGSEQDRIRGLDLGADDYLTKPVSLRELAARVRAILRRVDALTQDALGPQGAKRRTFGQLVLDPVTRQVLVAGRELELTAKEFDLLLHFLRHPQRVFTRADLLEAVWGFGYDGFEHTVNSHINRLRSKINAGGPRQRFIETVWGVGYRLAEPAT